MTSLKDIWNDNFPPLNLYNCPNTHRYEQLVQGRMYKTVETQNKGEAVYVVYSKEKCPNCTYAKNLLKSKGVDFTEVNIEQDAVAKEFLLQEGHKSVPQIYKDGELVQGGYAGLVKLNQEGNL